MSIAPTTERLALARELVDDVELSRLGPEQLLLKATRLARLCGDSKTLQWLNWELAGYPAGDEAFAAAAELGRVVDMKQQTGYWLPLAGIAGQIASMEAQIRGLQIPSIQFAPSSANPNEYVTGFAGLTADKLAKPAKDVLARLQALTKIVGELSGIRSRVLARVHAFAVGVYHDLAYSGVAESIFAKHKSEVDALLRSEAQEALDKIPALYDRLSAGDREAVSQAMNTLRRMIKAFADRVYPPSDDTRTVDGQSYAIGSDKVLNRIKLYLSDRCSSATRRDRLSRILRDIWERASAASHAEVSPEEAKALFLQTYLSLGEILQATQGQQQLAAP